MSAVLFGSLEREYGLPYGILDRLWEIESGRGRNMLNPESGAKGHFQMMPENYMRSGIDPMDLVASANWTARNAADALRRFPELDPVAAVAAHHFAGPNTALWGPKTRQYVSNIQSRMGEDEGIPMIPASQIAPPFGGVLDLAPPEPVMGPMAYPQLRTRDLIRDPRFWFDMAAATDPRQAPMAALATGLSNAYTRADERRLAFEGSMLDRQERARKAQLTQRQLDLAETKYRQTLPLEQQRVQNELARIRLEGQRLAKGPIDPSAVRSFEYFSDIFGPEQAARMVSPGGVSPEEAARRVELETWAKMRPEYIQQKSDELSAMETTLSETQRLLSDFEKGRFKGDTGPIRGLITQYFDPDVAVLQAANTSAALQQLSNVNLAPISNYEIQLMQRLYASETRNEAQNIAILKELRRVQARKVGALRDVIRRLNAGESQQDIYLNPPDLDIEMRYDITPTGVVERRETQPTEQSKPAGWNEFLEGF